MLYAGHHYGRLERGVSGSAHGQLRLCGPDHAEWLLPFRAQPGWVSHLVDQPDGGVETLDDTHRMRMAGRFSRRVRGWAKANGVPVIDCQAGERKHDLAEEHLKTTPVTRGIFLILVRKAQAPVWEVKVSAKQHHPERKKPMPYVNHNSFHILDPDWGHITIKISGHPPFPAQIMLHGHECVACQAQREGIAFTKEGNCFTQVARYRPRPGT